MKQLNLKPMGVRRNNARLDMMYRNCVLPVWHPTSYIPTAVITMQCLWSLHWVPGAIFHNIGVQEPILPTSHQTVDWLNYFLLFYVLLKNTSLIRSHHSWWRNAKFRPMFDTKNLWAGRDLYRATSAGAQGLGFSDLIRRTTPFCCLS
jgi:hypothetical protein